MRGEERIAAYVIDKEVFVDVLGNIYRHYLLLGRRRVVWIESYVSEKYKSNASADERYLYRVLFSEGKRKKVESIYASLSSGMKGAPYKSCEDLLDAMAFIQEVASAAMWKYGQDVGGVIEKFAREYDRLDIESERVRLYASFQ